VKNARKNIYRLEAGADAIGGFGGTAFVVPLWGLGRQHQQAFSQFRQLPNV